MPLISDPIDEQPVKLLFIGDSSTGKTGALGSLAAAGYNLRILDFDNGSRILRDLCLGTKALYPREAAQRIHYFPCSDEMQTMAGNIIPKKALAWNKAITKLHKWEDKETGVDFGPVTGWGSDTVLVVDSLSMACNAALNWHLQMNAKLGKTRTQNEIRRDIGAVQGIIELLLQMLYDPSIKCHVIVIAHITYVIDDEAKAPGVDGENENAKLPRHGYPAAIGQSLSPRIPRYFNTVLQAKVQGIGPGAKHKIYTKTQGAVGLKTAAPTSVAPEYPLETGLADFFKVLRGGLVPTPAAPKSEVKTNG